MSDPTVNFTKALLQSLSCPPGLKRVYFRDEKERGLIVDVRNTGTKSFYLYKKVGGRPERIHLGQFPDLTVENARKMAISHKASIANGKNPQSEKRKVRQEMTFGELFEFYIERHSKPHKKSWEYDVREVNEFLIKWFNRKLSNITRNEVQKLHTKIAADNGLYQANRILERTRAIYNKGIEWGWEGVNPAIGIKKFKEKSRDRFLQGSELPRFFEALALEENAEARDFFILALTTGARKTNILSMRWEELDLERGIWRIPETKNGDSHLVPLVPEALELLKARQASSQSTWVLPGTGRYGYLNDPKKAWQRILERAGLANLRIHDLRRTLGSWQAATGATGYVIGKTLGHKSPQSTAVYARLDLDPVRASITTAVDAMFSYGRKT